MVDAAGAAAGDEVPDGRVFPRAAVVEIHGDPACGERAFGIAEDRESALREDVEFDEADLFDGVHVEVGGRPAFGACEGRGEFVDRIAGEDDPARVDLRVAGESVEQGGQAQGGLRGFVIEESVRSGGGDAGGFFGVPGGGKRQVLGQPPGLVVGEAEDLGDFGQGGAGVEGIESTDRRDMAGRMLVEKQFDDLVFPVVREIHVDVGQLVERHAVAVEEALKIQLEADRTNIADPEAIAHERVRRAAACDPLDSLALAVLEQIPDGEEILRVADLRDDREFGLELGAVVGGGIAGFQAGVREARKKFLRRAGVRRIEARKPERLEIKGEIALDDFIGGPRLNKRRPAGLFRMRLIEKRERANALQDPQGAGVGRAFHADWRTWIPHHGEPVAVRFPKIPRDGFFREQAAEVCVAGLVPGIGAALRAGDHKLGADERT